MFIQCTIRVHRNDDHYCLGLMRDDMIRLWNPGVEEAISRLPADLKHDRNFRISRAQQLSLQKEELPESEWITPETVR